MRILCDACESAAAIVFCAADEAALCRSCDDKVSSFLFECSVLLIGLLLLQVHMCNKLASRHVRVGLATPSEVPRCDICENAPGMMVSFSPLVSTFPFSDSENVSRFFGVSLHFIYYCFSSKGFELNFSAVETCLYVAFFYCEVDGSSLCLHCDMIVHVGGKRTHGRYLLLRQRVEFPGDKCGIFDDPASVPAVQAETRRVQNQPLRLTMRENQQNHTVSSLRLTEGNVDGNAKMDTKLIDLNMPQGTHEHGSNNQVRSSSLFTYLEMEL
ncbi:hypothetical protein JRO89_XS08G0134600 [Xanthoceras sorbifolium]|uniref:B box-type domain-containing protein n=1 Tax=Xanthoceras sorbifolium TaxID=99658 RepID=A0ABQ8HPL8_9ROSI|nr:hypothetical protein JRO89_XS08G0134600 [Xanthoceras sorbifolium]